MACFRRLRELFRELRLVEFRLRLLFRPIQMHATDAQLPVGALIRLHRAAVAADAHTGAHVAQFRTRHDSSQRAVVHLAHENAHAVVDFDQSRAMIVRIVEIMRHDKAVHANGTCSRDSHDGPHRMRAIIRHRHPRTPVFRAGSQLYTAFYRHGMDVFRFAVQHVEGDAVIGAVLFGIVPEGGDVHQFTGAGQADVLTVHVGMGGPGAEQPVRRFIFA